MKDKKKFIRSLIFNIAETIIIILIGKFMSLPFKFIILLMTLFMITRSSCGRTFHYKTWYRCLIWSILILLSLFMLLKVDLCIAIILTIFSAFIMTGKADINEMYLWKPQSQSKYKDIEEYIDNNADNQTLLDFENSLRKISDILFSIYTHKFKEKLTFREISDKMGGLESARITEKLNQIALAIRISCKIQ